MKIINLLKWFTPSLYKKKNYTNKEKGDKFEQLIVSKFDERYFLLKEWRSDKGINGRYAESNKNPDLEFEFHINNTKYVFAVECKWRQNYYKNGIYWAKKRQVDRYNKYAANTKKPVFIIIGVGGKPEHPNEIFVAPLTAFKFGFVTKNYLQKFKKKNVNKNFFLNTKNNVLKLI